MKHKDNSKELTSISETRSKDVILKWKTTAHTSGVGLRAVKK